jgi:squalene synthase HpnC
MTEERRSMTFSDDLRQYGPGTSLRVSRDDALAYCARLTATHYENFSVVTWLTPREHRPAFQNIYAFCRWSDDLGDEVGDPEKSLELLDWWRGELRAMYHDDVRHPVMIALAETVKRYHIPIDPFEALISAFEQDQRVTEYLTYEQLLDYCVRSANPVGHLVLYVAGAFSPEHARLSDATCTALQLANFWQDVARDLAIGRIYLPREDLARFGYSDSDLRALRFTPAFAELLQFEVARARDLLSQGRPLVPRIPGPLAVDVDLFSRGGSAILDRIEASGFDVLSARPALSRWTKLGLLGRAITSMALARLGQRRFVTAGIGDPQCQAEEVVPVASRPGNVR